MTEQLKLTGSPGPVSVQLQRMGRLNARVIPATAALKLDGSTVKNPLKRRLLSPGEHTLEGTFEHGGRLWREARTFLIKSGERRSIVLELKPPR